MSKRNRHGVNIPGQLLDQIRDTDHYETDERFNQNKKRKTISRKDRRKSQRDEKKNTEYSDLMDTNQFEDEEAEILSQLMVNSRSKLGSSVNEEEDHDDEDSVMAKLKAMKAKKGSKTTSFKIVKEDDLEKDEVSDLDKIESEEEEDNDDDEDSVMAKLKAMKEKKGSKTSSFKIVKEDDLEEDEVSDLDGESESEEDEENESEEEDENDDDEDSIVKEDDLEDDEVSDLDSESQNESEEDEENESEEDDDDDDEDSVMAKLKAMKAKKGSKTSSFKIEEKYVKTISSHERDLLKKDEEDIDYYAKKLGLKKGKSLSKQGDDDIIGGLLDGLDMDFDNSDNEFEFEGEEEEEKHSKLKKKSKEEEYDDDDDEESDDFDDDDDLDEDDKALLLKENPYVAPISQEDLNLSSNTKYIPPALRRKMALEENSNNQNEAVLKLIKNIKGPMNRLSEPNLITVVNDLNSLYNDNPRQIVNEAIVKVIIDSVLIPGSLLDSFLIMYSSVIVSIFKLQGVEFGAFTIQTIVEKLTYHLNNNDNLIKGKQCVNLIALLGFCYNLNLVGSKLIYDIISQKLIKDTNEMKTDILLRLVKVSGSKMRYDDPSSLKEIIIELNKSIIKNENSKNAEKPTTRSKFLIETITNLKNNKIKSVENENSNLMLTRIKKQFGRVSSNKNLDPIKVTLDDIENIESRGKWWLVGSAWKGKSNENNSGNDNTDSIEVNDQIINDILDTADLNWLELAKQQRMNTDIRRAIFVSIMSANDYMDSFTKLEKLRLKKSQEREIPRILMHCASLETISNPYYGYLGKKLCEDHSMRKTFQFNLWDLLKEFDNENENENDNDLMDVDLNEDENKLKKILNLGRLFGFLIAESSLPLNIMRTINFLTASSDTKLFIEIMLITFLDTVAKNSELKSFGSGLTLNSKTRDLKFDDKIIFERLAKCKEQTLLLKGLQFFLTDTVRGSSLIKGKKQTIRVNWGIDSMCDTIDTILERSN
ncbi:hypothetical protein CANARDRAFT_239325 [[Candida] arabinofermentans NRRL YB-2248]|uniref:MI domain-containing protein n=1 Tax=[Candida] arabinofermentans NRRL YB-2248 TaxID=983967 RepID=A0A1E4STM6_9ASCO|nr:hypothetical protein CANARDRAFT_239325 [[Candida] arabinofermentans NRRL YB-2248]